MNITLNKPIFLFDSVSLFKIMVLFMSAFPLLPYAFRSIVTILLLAIALYIKKTEYRGLLDLVSQKLVILILPFFILIITLIYSHNLIAGVNKLIQMLSLLIFPIIFFLTKEFLNKELINKAILVFALSVILLTFYEISLCVIDYDYLTNDLTKVERKLNNIKDGRTLIDNELIQKVKTRRLRQFLLDKTDTHSTYLGLWIVFSIYALFINFVEKKGKFIVRILTFLLIIFLIIWLLIIASRIAVITLTISLAFLFYFKGNLSVKKILMINIVALMAFFVFYKFIPSFNNRVNEVLRFDLKLPTKGDDVYNFNSSNVRVGIYYCGLKTIKENLFFGVGVGDSQSVLNDCYKNKIGSKIYFWTDYNTHNQFLFFLISAGILGLITFVLSLVYQFKIAIKKSNHQHIYFLIIIVCFCLTENILVRSDGVIFYAFFGSLMLFNYNPYEIYDSN